MADNFLPNGDRELFLWSRNFANHINSLPEEFGLNPEQSAQYASLDSSYAAALTAATDPATRTRATVASKNDFRTLLKTSARQLARIVQAHPAVNDGQRVILGLSVRAGGGASPAIHRPDEAPLVQIMYTSGRLVKVKLRRTDAPGRGRAPASAGANVFSFVGDFPPLGVPGWTFERSTTRTNFDVEIGANVPPGSKVWFAAFWYSPRGDRGPMSLPASTYIGEGVAKAA